jgi:RNA polymerase sigma-70 factor (ECF subfamily)
MLLRLKGAEPSPAAESGRPRDDLASLAAAVARGEREAVRTFVMATGGMVRGGVRMVLGSGDIEDVTQDAMIELLRALPRFRGECTVAQFAARVAVLTAMSARRRRRVQERWISHDAGEGEGAPSELDATPQAEAEAGRRRGAVRRLLDELPQPIAEAMALYFILGHTVHEIAAATNAPVGTVASRLRIGKERLRRRLAGDAALSEELGAPGSPR